MIQDKSITLVGLQAALGQVTLFPQADGSVLLVASGTTKDAGSNVVALKEARIQALGVVALDNLVARALSELRKANGLEV